MHVGVIVPAFNIAAWIGQAMQSVLSQTFTTWSMVVVDDGSTDATADIAAAFRDPRIRLIRQSNQGVSAARNRGLDAIEADAILFLDGDDWLAPDALALLVASLETSPSAVAAAGGYVRIMTNGSRHVVPAPPSGMLLRRLLVRNLFVNGGHLLIRRGAIAAAGVFDSSLDYGEDWEYWTRIAALGAITSARTPEPLLFVRERTGSAYRTMACEPHRFDCCMKRIFANPTIRARIGMRQLNELRRRAEAEKAWVIGRELTRHVRLAEGQAWLARSLWAAPGLKRFGLMGLSWLRAGPFQAYRP